jgi:hypothetical protein
MWPRPVSEPIDTLRGLCQFCVILSGRYGFESLESRFVQA